MKQRESEHLTEFMIRLSRGDQEQWLYDTDRGWKLIPEPPNDDDRPVAKYSHRFESVGAARRRLRCNCIKEALKDGWRVDILEVVTYQVTQVSIKQTSAKDAITKLGLVGDDA